MKRHSSLRETEQAIIDAACGLLERRLRRQYHRHTEVFDKPDDAAKYFQLKLSGQEQEVFAGILLDNKHRMLRYEEFFQGTVDSCAAHPREIVKAALSCNATSLILAHNHPSGVPQPSAGDREATKRIDSALELIGVRLLDHIIVGHGQWFSFSRHGLL